MAASETEMGHSEPSARRQTLRTWIESPDGSIARGVVLILSMDGALVELAESAGLDAGAEVSVRLSLDPSSPTLGLAATVLWVSSKDETGECELEWKSGVESARLASLITSLSEA